MKWDGTAYANEIKRGLFLLLTDLEIQKARFLSHKEYTELFKQHIGQHHAFGGIALDKCFVPYQIMCKSEQIEIDLKRPLNNLGDTIISMPWSMAARHIRYWVKEENRQKQETEGKAMTEFNFGAMMSQENQIKQIPVDMLVPYHNHKFTLYEGERLDDMVESIRKNGVMTPIIVQPLEDGNYEILIGHNRWNASKIAGQECVPAIIKENLTEEEAEIYVIESNLLQRGFSELKTSEQAQVLALRYEGMFSQGKRNDIINELLALEGKSEQKQKHNSREEVGAEYGLSRNTVARLLRVNKLHDGIKEWVDNGELSVRAAVELSYLSKDEQEQLYRTNTDCTTGGMSRKISEKIARQLRAAADQDDVSGQMASILSGEEKEKKPSGKSVKIDGEVFDRYFTNIDKKQISSIVESALRMYFAGQTE